jgi:glycosyltransferase involved in cell wall biosynthesis
MTLLHILAGTGRGGCEGNAMCLIRESPSIGHQLLVLGEPGEMSAEFAAIASGIHHAGLPSGGMRRTVRTIEAFIAEHEPDGVIAWHGMVALPEILHALRDFRGRVLVHGGNPASQSGLVDAWYWMREKWLGRGTDPTYVCCSRHVADSFDGSLYLRRFARTVVPNGVAEPTVSARAPRPIAAGEPFTVGMVARLDHIKDHPTLLRAFARVVEAWPSARLELAGDGERRDELEHLVCELRIGEQVRFLGTVADPYAVMRNWDLFAYATTWREGLGNALIEALRSGLPCVACDAGPVRELLGDHETGVVIPPGDPEELARAIMDLALDLPQRQSLSARASSWSMERFSGARFASGYRELLGMENVS